jgi:hypothetical protein
MGTHLHRQEALHILENEELWRMLGDDINDLLK